MIWQPSLNEFQELFNNDYILKILSFLNINEYKNVTPIKLSTLLNMHVSTAKKYLELLNTYKYVTKEVFHDRPGKPSLYTLTSKRIEIVLDLDSFVNQLDISSINIWNPIIREKTDLEPLIKYKFDNEGLLKEIKVKFKTKAKRYISKTMILTKNEQLFMKYLPHPTMDPNYLVKICYKAKIENVFDIKSIEDFVRKLEKYNIIDLITD